MVGIDLETNVEKIQVIDQMIEQEKVEMILDRNHQILWVLASRWPYLETLLRDGRQCKETKV